MRRLATSVVVTAAVLIMCVTWVSTASAAPVPLTCDSTGTVMLVGDMSVRLSHDLACNVDLEGRGSPAINLAHHTLHGNIINGARAIIGQPESTPTIIDGTIDGDIVSPGRTSLPACNTIVTLKHVHMLGRVNESSVDLRHSELDGSIISVGQATVHDSVVHGGVASDDFNCVTGVDIRNSTVGGVSFSVLNPLLDFRDQGGVISHSVIPGGIHAQGIVLSDLVVDHVLVSGCSGDGISIAGGTPARPGLVTATFTHNTVTDCGGHGFNVQPTTNVEIIDGGGNHASGNALDPQCIGIVCKP
jgi:hypothetical protein